MLKLGDEEAVRMNFMGAAAAIGCRELCEIAKKGGATDFSDMLMNAAINGRFEPCLLAREWGAARLDPESLTDLLHKAVMKRRLELAELFLRWATADCTAQEAHAAVAKMLDTACCEGYPEFIELALARGESVDCSRLPCGLNKAASRGALGDCVELMRHGASNYDDMLQMGAYGGHEAVCRAAVEKGADPNIALLSIAGRPAPWTWQYEDHPHGYDMASYRVHAESVIRDKTKDAFSLLRELGASDFEGMRRAALLVTTSLPFAVALAEKWIAEGAPH